MSKTAVITPRADEETLGLVDQVVQAHGRSRAWFIAQAAKEAAPREAEVQAFIQEGVDAVERGDVTPHEQVKAETKAMIARHRARRCD